MLEPVREVEIAGVFASSRSRPKAATLNAPITILQIAKKSQPASEKTESRSNIGRTSAARGGLRTRLAPAMTDLRPGRCLLLRRSRRLLVHAPLHAGFMIRFHLLELSFLVRGQQLIELVVHARMLHSKGGLDLRFLGG